MSAAHKTFRWLPPDVYPVIAAVGLGCAFSVYSMARGLWTNPEVFPNKTARMEGVPESGITEQRAAGFKTSVYRSMKGNTTKIF